MLMKISCKCLMADREAVNLRSRVLNTVAKFRGVARVTIFRRRQTYIFPITVRTFTVSLFMFVLV